jgi:predicted  nucleic acid-binding Zn-ribbon protein
MSDEIFDWMAAANRKAKGKRPEYFTNPEDERILSILMAVVGEVSVLRERLDTVERLLDSKGTISRQDIESYTPDKQAAYERGAMIREYIYRVMRGPQQMVDELQQAEPEVEEISRELREI